MAPLMVPIMAPQWLSLMAPIMAPIMAPKMAPLFRAKVIFRTIKNERMTFEHINVPYLKHDSSTFECTLHSKQKDSLLIEFSIYH